MFRLQYERIVRHVSQAKLASQTGILKPHIALMESGRLVPTDDELARIGRAIGLAPDVLMTTVRVEPDEPRVAEL